MNEIERAIRALTRHVTRNSDGTFEIHAKTAKDAGIEDEVLFGNLVASVEVTNGMIRRGDINPDDVLFP